MSANELKNSLFYREIKKILKKTTHTVGTHLQHCWEIPTNFLELGKARETYPLTLALGLEQKNPPFRALIHTGAVPVLLQIAQWFLSPALC